MLGSLPAQMSDGIKDGLLVAGITGCVGIMIVSLPIDIIAAIFSVAGASIYYAR